MIWGNLSYIPFEAEAVEAAAFLTLLVFEVVEAASATAVGVSFGELLLLERGRFFAATIEVGLEVLLEVIWLSNRLASVWGRGDRDDSTGGK